jgi:hypothetical protein
VVKKRKHDLSFAVRFRAYGKREYVTLGYGSDGWNRQRAEVELQNTLADVRRGLWRPPEPPPEMEPQPAEAPTTSSHPSGSRLGATTG